MRRVCNSASAYLRSCFRRRFSPAERQSAMPADKAPSSQPTASTTAKAAAMRDLLETHEADVDVDRLGIAVGEYARQQHQHEQNGDESEPAQRYQECGPSARDEARL